ncbi:MAG TPA: ShlB/FhaC/HecB family hemolysin secretion/activation protein, partial [Rhodocyclaceae bacterium]|nr:ShlB/FhaC/HecB family hemolysin secretion/activation protein [Rhodocyclaceae bacterium]
LARPAPRVTEPAAPNSDPGLDPSQLKETGPTFPIRRIVVKGDTILSDEVREQILAPFAGLDLGAKRIDLLLRRLTAAYIDRGYLTTRPYVAPQNLASGTLEVTVIPGTVESIQLNGQPLTGPAKDAAPTAPGDVLRLADIEQTVDQINRLRSQRAQAQVLPGQSPGTSVVSIANQPDKPWRVSLGTDNYGQPSTGQGRLRYGFDLDNLLGAWEAISASHIESRNSHSELFALSVPFGYGTLSYAFADSASRSAIGTIAFEDTRSRNQTLAWNQVIARDSRGRTAFDAAFAQRETWRRVADVDLVPQQQASLRLALSRQQRLSIGSVSAEFGLTRGLNIMGDDTDLPGLPDSASHNQFDKIDLNLSAILALNDSWAWRGNLIAQASRVGLPSAEQLFVGGNATVRGFQEGIIAGDRGYVLRNELQWTGAMPRSLLAANLRLEPFVFTDSSRTRALADSEAKSLSSVGLGLRLNWTYASLDIAWARPQAAPDGSNILRQDRVHANLTLQY